MDLICVAMCGRNPENPSDRTVGIKTEQRLEPKIDETSNTLTSVQKDNLVYIKQRGRGFNKGGDHFGKTPTLSSNSWDHNNTLYGEQRIRRLTPTECARLQTIPNWYKWDCVSDTQRYRMLGNGWTVEVIKHIFSFLFI
jgi:DNA (cytosine-5)-methyltransferase 3A